jgi:predicted  nucleic acid-binding Zn-ribbon protein
MLQQNMENSEELPSSTEKKKESPVIDEDTRQEALKQLQEEGQTSDTPETIDIEHPGKYSIDLKGLLEQEPIIIQKDGSYTIHLPSVFKMIDHKKK